MNIDNIINIIQKTAILQKQSFEDIVNEALNDFGLKDKLDIENTKEGDYLASLGLLNVICLAKLSMKKEYNTLEDYKEIKNMYNYLEMEEKLMNKTKAIMLHLEEKGSITSWEAIKEYGATRLSAIIFELRNRYNMNIITESVEFTDRFGNKSMFANYIYVKGE